MNPRDLLSDGLREQFATHPNASILAVELSDDEWDWVQEEVPGVDQQTPEVIRLALKRLARARRAFRLPVRAPRQGRAPSRSPRAPERAVTRLFALDATHNRSVHSFRQAVLAETLLTAYAVGPWIAEQRRAQGPTTPRTRDRRTNSDRIRVPMLACRFPESETTSWIPTKQGSVLDRLRRICEALSTHYGWHPAETTLFVLTGREPQHLPIRVTVRHRLPMQVRSRIVLEINPMATPTEVADVYARTRRHHFGRRLRRLSDKHAQLAVFELTHGASEASRANATWNRLHPQWRYTSLSLFRRDCDRAVMRLREMSLRPVAPHLP